jgi:hypothetical protein
MNARTLDYYYFYLLFANKTEHFIILCAVRVEAGKKGTYVANRETVGSS